MAKSYIERQKEFIVKNKLQFGDKLLLLREVEGREDGWENSWVVEMSALVGQRLIYLDHGGSSGLNFRADGNTASFGYPYFVFEKKKARLG